MAHDPFLSHCDSPVNPARAAFSVTPDDDVELPVVPKRIYIGSGGSITLRGIAGTADVTYENVADGVYLNIRPSHIRATGTTATDIVAEV